MLNLERTIGLAAALRQLVDLLACEVVALVLAAVAVVAEVRGIPAVPRGQPAAELALPLDEVLAVRHAVRVAHAFDLNAAAAD